MSGWSQRKLRVGSLVLSVRTWTNRAPSAPPVVLLPGTGATSQDWDAIAAVLAGSRTVHAVDLRGHGDSDWPGEYSTALMAGDVVGLLEQVSEPAVDVVGHSLGGLVACRAVAARPGLVRRLVLEDVPMPKPRRPATPARPEGPLDFDWAVVEQVRPEIDDPDPGWVHTMRAISVATLVIAGGATSPVPQEDVRELVSVLPDGRTVTVEAGHLVHERAPEEFLAHLLEFLQP